MTRRRLIVVVAVAVLLAGAAGVLLLVRSSRSTPVSRQQAVNRFRHGGSRGGGRPTPGVYTYAVSGWECAGIASVCLRRDLPATAQLIVSRRGDTLTLELDFSQQHIETQRYRLTSGGRVLIWQRTRLSILGVTQDDAHATTPPTLALPSHPAVGETWTQRFSDQQIPVVSTSRVVRRERLMVAGRPVATVLISSMSNVGGAHPGTERDLDWYAGGLGIDARFAIVRRIGGAFPYKLTASGRLLNAAPGR